MNRDGDVISSRACMGWRGEGKPCFYVSGNVWTVLPVSSRFSLLKIARLGVPELTLTAAELKPTGGGSEHKE